MHMHKAPRHKKMWTMIVTLITWRILVHTVCNLFFPIDIVCTSVIWELYRTRMFYFINTANSQISVKPKTIYQSIFEHDPSVLTKVWTVLKTVSIFAWMAYDFSTQTCDDSFSAYVDYSGFHTNIWQNESDKSHFHSALQVMCSALLWILSHWMRAMKMQGAKSVGVVAIISNSLLSWYCSRH